LTGLHLSSSTSGPKRNACSPVPARLLRGGLRRPMPGSVKGHRSAADWIAAATGSHISDAVEMLQTARRLEELPLIRGAFRAGELSEEQARVISEAAYADPRRERELIAAAHAETVKTLRVECKRVKNAAAADERARLEAIHRRRSHDLLGRSRRRGADRRAIHAFGRRGSLGRGRTGEEQDLPDGATRGASRALGGVYGRRARSARPQRPRGR